MANTLTNLLPDLYAALDVVSREMSGFALAGTLDAQATRIAVGEVLRIPVTPAGTTENIVAGQLPPDTGDQVIGNASLQITKSVCVPFRWNGEEQKGINNGVGYANIRRDQIAQAIRALVNALEVDAGVAMYQGASRAWGTAGTTPFASNFNELPQLGRILRDNGATYGNWQLVCDTTAGANLRSLPNLYKVNEAGTNELLKQGLIAEQLQGFNIRESVGVQAVVKGGGSAYVTSGSTAPGVNAIALVTGSGTVLAGDVVTFAADTANKYVVGTGVAAPGTIQLNSPGARITIPTGNALTIGNNYTANCAFAKTACLIAARPPALPEEGDMASDRMLITDPRTGLTFDLAMYPQYRRIRYEIALAWGVKNIKPEHSAILLG
jgi:hypothetical protein